MENNSDYKKIRTRIDGLLPDPNRSEINESIFENSFNRFLTKNETTYVDGYIGTNNRNAINSRQIQEETIARQANQLQPILSASIGSERRHMSWQDVLNELERHGIDINEFADWGQTEKYNWVPPIDIDKIINFQDYFWVNDNANSRLEYITIKNKLTLEKAKLNIVESAISQYGNTFELLTNSSTFRVNGDFTNLFETGFTFFVKNSTNSDINNLAFNVKTSTYENNITEITVDNVLTQTIDDGIISLDEQLNISRGMVACQSGDIENINKLFNNSDDLIRNIRSIGQSSDPISTEGAYGDIAYSIESNNLFQKISNSTWKILFSNINIQASSASGTSACYVDLNSLEAQWSSNNSWLHRSDVTNFASARQANYPIIEFLNGIELNQFSEIVHDWNYRPTLTAPFNNIHGKPTLLELMPFNEFSIDASGLIITLSPIYGNATNIFAHEFEFTSNIGDLYVVQESTYERNTNGMYETKIRLNIDSRPATNSATEFNPVRTSNGDAWIGYNQHWVYNGIINEIPSENKQLNFQNNIDISNPIDTSNPFYSTRTGNFSEEFTIRNDTNTELMFTTPSLQTLALFDVNAIRVYINGKRQYGTYNEIVDSSNQYVIGIDLFSTTLDDVILIEVAPATLEDFGFQSISVRTEINDSLFNLNPSFDLVDLTRFRRIEQIKSTVNQYPSFNIFNTNGSSANVVSNIFSYKINQSQPAITELGLRIDINSTDNSFQFNQHLFDNSKLLSYKINDQSYQFWFDNTTQTVYKLVDSIWVSEFLQGNVYSEVLVSDEVPILIFDEMLWFNPSTNTLNEYNASSNEFISIDNILISNENPLLSTIWKKSEELYFPIRKDWHGRTLEEYNQERDSFVSQELNTLSFENPEFSQTEMELEANNRWLNTQQNNLSPTGEWIGEWTIPDYMYYNLENQNRSTISRTELVAHFNSIIESQNKIPSFLGSKQTQFHALDITSIDFGLGGTIRQYNNNFSTFLSSIFIDNVITPDLIEFAQNQYQILLERIKSISENSIVSAVSNDIYNFDLIKKLNSLVEQTFVQDSNLEFLYGDSTNFDDGIGYRNWIATLPNLGFSNAVIPSLLIDKASLLYEVVHHDGHRVNYKLDDLTENKIFNDIISSLELSGNLFRSDSVPPQIFAWLAIQLMSTDVIGTFWFDEQTNSLYQLTLDFVGSTEPDPALGKYWFDSTNSTLNESNGSIWSVVLADNLFDGIIPELSNINLWKKIDINELLATSIFEVEKWLYESKKDFNLTIDENLDLEEFFLRYVRTRKIDLPFTNINYSPIDAFTWNYYNSVAGTRYTMLLANPITNEFVVDGLFATSFVMGNEISVKNSGINDGMWTVVSSREVDGTTIIAIEEPITSSNVGILYKPELPSPYNSGGESSANWKSLYFELYGTPRPHLEPWALQGFTDKPSWWDAEYLNNEPKAYGTRRWKYNSDFDEGMWKNIRLGIVPRGMELPDGTVSDGLNARVSTYRYVSVNTENNVISSDNISFYEPDDILPPYFNHISANLLQDSFTRSVFDDFNLNILSPDNDYEYGQRGPHETNWRFSSQYLYDVLSAQYKFSPIEFLIEAFGFEYDKIDGLLIDTQTHNVPTNKNTIFHGTVQNSTVVKSCGLNQWFINYNRYTGIDSNFSNFSTLWQDWKAPLSYQFNSFIDDGTFDIDAVIDIENSVDYEILIKQTNGVESFSAYGLMATLINLPPNSIIQDDSPEWGIQLSNNSSKNVDFEYHPPRNYPFFVDVENNICTIFQYPVKNVIKSQQVIEIFGDVTDVIVRGDVLSINQESDQTISVLFSTYNERLQVTQITTNEILFGLNIKTVTVNSRTLPWETGDSIWLTTNNSLPAPLMGDNPVIGPIEYFIIKLNETQFQISETPSSAQSRLPILLKTTGESIHYVGQFNNTFIVNNGRNTSTNWRHFVLDTRYVSSFRMPIVIKGIQSFINLIDGYVNVLTGNGFDFSDNRDRWQDQIEEFIDYCFSSRNLLRNRTIDNRYQIIPNQSTNSWSFADVGVSPFKAGTEINLIANNGSLPTPFLHKIKYFIILNGDGTFSLANSMTRANLSVPIPFMDNGSAMSFEVHAAVENTTRFPRIEVNSFKDRLTFRQPYGIVSNIIEGPFDDDQIVNTVLDRHGDPLTIRDIIIARKDRRTDIFLTGDLRTDQTLVSNIIDPIQIKNYHYISAATLYLDTYEHIVEFNNYNTSDQLIYDSFLGLNLQRMNVNFNRQSENTRRPNIGGSVVIKNSDRFETINNMERTVSDLREAYGSPTRNESNHFAPFAQKTLGYDINSTEEYLSELNINEQSQFQFWQGLIQTKGSVRSVNAFINSRQFVDANVDEFWAYQIAEFGSTEERECPELYVNLEDITNNNIKLEFIPNATLNVPGYDNNPYDIVSFDSRTGSDASASNNFIPISLNDSNRWFRQPDQFQVLANNGMMMFFESTPSEGIVINNAEISALDDPIVVHNLASDRLLISFEMDEIGYDRYISNTTQITDGFNANSNRLILRNNVLPFTTPVVVVKNGLVLNEVSDYIVTSNITALELFSNELSFTTPLLIDDVIEVSYNKSILLDNLHYTKVNSNIVRFNNKSLLNSGAKITIHGIIPNFEAHNASQLVDTESSTVISSVNMFDPARGMFNTQVSSDVDVISDINPAYAETRLDSVVDERNNTAFINKDFWGVSEVGTTWLDTSELEYLPYYDEVTFPSLNDRLNLWGKQADYSNITVWEWIESNVPPEDYDSIAAQEQGNSDIPEFIRKSGNARKIIYRFTEADEFDNPPTLVELKNEVRTFVVLLDGIPTENNREYSFELDTKFVTSPLFGALTYDIHVNGQLRESNVQMLLDDGESTITVILENLSASDTVTFIHCHKPTDELIEIAVDNNDIRVGYEYTKVDSFNKDGVVTSKYYFWVKNKLTRSRNSSNSPKTIENLWTQTNNPYLVLQNPIERAQVNSIEVEDFDVQFNIHVNEQIRKNNIFALQLDNQSKYDGSGANGTFNGGNGYEIGDLITLNSGAIIEVMNLIPVGTVSAFRVIFTGDLVLPNQKILSNSTTGNGLDFSITPNLENLGGFELNLNSSIKTSSQVSLSVNGRELTENEHYTLVSDRKINILVDYSLDSNINVSFISERPIQSSLLPTRYTQAIIRNIRNFVTESNRYTIQFRRDFTVDDRSSSINNKNLHREWKLFRRHQNFKIDLFLWNKIIESMIGYKLSDETCRVPSIDRELYDEQTNSDTRFGIGIGQTFTDGRLSIQTILSDLSNPENNFRGIDISSFFTMNNFDNNENIIRSMTEIYNTFNVDDVNRMYFLVLNDAMSLKSRYEKFLKTSMISVYGVRVIDTQGEFDE